MLGIFRLIRPFCKYLIYIGRLMISIFLDDIGPSSLAIFGRNANLQCLK